MQPNFLEYIGLHHIFISFVSRILLSHILGITYHYTSHFRLHPLRLLDFINYPILLLKFSLLAFIIVLRATQSIDIFCSNEPLLPNAAIYLLKSRTNNFAVLSSLRSLESGMIYPILPKGTFHIPHKQTFTTFQTNPSHQS